MGVLKKIFDLMADKSTGDLLFPLSLGDSVCVDCAKLLGDAHIRCREEIVWETLPRLLGAGRVGKV